MYATIANIENLILCAMLLMMLFWFNLRYWKPNIINPLSLIYIFTIADCVLEAIAFKVDGVPELALVNILANMFYFLLIGAVGVSMMAYCNSIFPEPIYKTKKQFLLFMIPFYIEVLALISAPFTKLIFYVDSAGFYHRSISFWIQFIPYGYLALTTILGIYWFRKAETTRERNQYLTISLFALPPFLLGGIQIFIKANSLDILLFSVTLSLVANFAVTQNNRITTDTLTGLVNREVFDSLLDDKMKNGRRGEKQRLFVMMGDLDGFKKINDIYGHVEGDRALILGASALQEIAGKYQGISARIGGDEFAVILEAPSKEVPESIVEELDRKLLEVSENEKFTLRMSLGFAEYRSGDTVTDIVKAADRDLYRIKGDRKYWLE